MLGLLCRCISAITPRSRRVKLTTTITHHHHHHSDLGNQRTQGLVQTYPATSESDTGMDRTMHQQQPSIASGVADVIVSTTLSQYASLPAIAPQPGKHTVLASFVLHDPRSDRVRLLSLGAGVKCLPAHRLPRHGDALHDSHAEVIARRGAIRWLLEEVQRDARARGRGRDRARAQNENENEEGSRFESVEAEADAWVCAGADGLYALRDDVQLWMYASTVPCAFVPSSSHTPFNSTCHRRASHLT